MSREMTTDLLLDALQRIMSAEGDRCDCIVPDEHSGYRAGTYYDDCRWCHARAALKAAETAVPATTNTET